MNYDQALDRVRKLLAVADCASANSQEAETAARQAAALMEKFNIDSAAAQLADLTGDEPGLVQAPYAPGYCKGYDGPGAQKNVPPWLGFLAVGVARLAQVKADVTGLNGGRVVRFSGYSTDVAFAQWLLDVVARGVFNEAAKQPLPRAGRNTFRQAAAAAIQGRLVKMRAEQVAAMPVGNASTSTALAVVDLKAQKIAEAFGGMGTKCAQVRGDRDAFAAGQAYGQRVHLPGHRPLSGSSERPVLSYQA